jgi:CDP-glucose 4,6-dehydratase
MQSYLKSFFNPDDYSEHGVALASGRAGNVIGGGDWAVDRLIPDCIRAFEGKKEIIIRYPNATRPWQYVLEPLYGYLLLAQYLYEGGARYTGGWNFGSNNENSKPVHWLADKMVELWGGDSSWATDGGRLLAEANSLTLNCSKAIKQLGWEPKYDLGSTLENTIEWYKAFGNKQEMIKYTIEQIHSYEKNIN